MLVPSDATRTMTTNETAAVVLTWLVRSIVPNGGRVASRHYSWASVTGLKTVNASNFPGKAENKRRRCEHDAS
jgi:hypothetical protein